MRGGIQEDRGKRWRSGALVAACSLASGGCFALFGLDGYGPSATGEEGGGEVDAAPNDAPADAAGDVESPDVGSTRKLVFVTSERFEVGSDAFKLAPAVNVANDFCQTAAQRASLPGRFAAWFSDGASEPAKAFAAMADTSRDVHELVLRDGTVVAARYAELTESGPRVPIAVTETNMSLAEGVGDCNDGEPVWTGTTGRGDSASSNCSGWRSNSSSQTGRAGSLTVGPTWSSTCELQCIRRARLYCFEQ